MRWRYDGGDYLTGSDRIGGTGGMVSWHVNPPHFRANAWSKELNMSFKRKYTCVESAKKAVEKWIIKRSNK